MVINEHEGYPISNEILAKALLRILLIEGYISNATYWACIGELDGKQNKKYQQGFIEAFVYSMGPGGEVKSHAK